jgi:peptide/nickel transport system substrate-binding protein
MAGLKRLVVFLSIGLAWGGADDTPVVVGQTFMATSEDPTSGSAGWALTSHGVAEKLFTVDKNDVVVGQVADSISKISEFVWEVTLKPNYLFSDGHTLGAQDVADGLNELNLLNHNAKASLGNMTATAVGDLTVRIESERPTHVMDAVLAEWVFVVYKKDDSGNFVYTGPFAIKTLGETQIDLIPNPHYPFSEARPLVTVKKYASGEDLEQGLLDHKVDIAFHLPIETWKEVRGVDGITVKSFEVGYHNMMFYNLDRLPDVNVRKAIDVAISRTALSEAQAGGNPTRSLFPDFSPFFADDSSPEGAAAEAEALLDAAGWVMESSTGLREKDGEILAVTLVAYPHRPELGLMQPIIAEALRDIGFNVTEVLTGMEWDETQKFIDDRTFDLLMWAQHTLPAGDPLWFLSAFFRSDGGNNHANFTNTDVDTLIDVLSTAEEGPTRIAAAEDAHLAIRELVPVSNLVTPEWHIGLSARMAEYEPWGSDYYVIRSDLMLPETSTSTDGSTNATVAKSDSFSSRNFARGILVSLMIVALVF